MAGATKFTFDQEFTPDGRVRTVRKAEEQRLAAEAEQIGYRRGLDEGRREADAEATARTARACELIATRAEAVLARADEDRRQLEAEAARLAVAFARKLAGDLARVAPLARLEEAAAECFRELVGVPHVVVRIEATMVDAAKRLLDKMARERGFEGRLVVLGEPDLAAGDFTLEWAEGGVVRDGAALAALIDGAVARRFPAAGPAGGDLTDGE